MGWRYCTATVMACCVLLLFPMVSTTNWFPEPMLDGITALT